MTPGDGLASGVAVGDALGVASGEGLGVMLGDGVGDPFFLPRFGEGDGELFGVGVTEASGEAVGVGFGEALGVGVPVGAGLGELFFFGEGEGVGELFFFVLVELLRFFGGGVGSKMLLILSPNDCCAGAWGATLAKRNAAARRIVLAPM